MGYETPSIDRIAGEGVEFQHSFVPTNIMEDTMRGIKAERKIREECPLALPPAKR